jgi:hypothetical protein
LPKAWLSAMQLAARVDLFGKIARFLAIDGVVAIAMD